MDRIELANELINRGTEILLQESYGRNGAIYKATEAKINSIKNNINKRDFYYSAGLDDNENKKKELEKLEKFKEEADNIRKLNKSKDTRSQKTSIHFDDGKTKISNKSDTAKNNAARLATESKNKFDTSDISYKSKINEKINKSDYSYSNPAEYARRKSKEGHEKKGTQTESISELLIEASELLNDEIITESISPEIIAELSTLGVMLAALLGCTLYIDKKDLRNAIKNAIVVSQEEYNEALEYITSCKPKIEKLFATSKYKKYIDSNIIDIICEPSKIDLTDKETSKRMGYHKNKPFSCWYNLFNVNIRDLAKETGILEKIIVTDDRLNEYIKKETEEVAKIIDKVRSLLYQNKIVKKLFNIELWYNNENKTTINCTAVNKNWIILDTSKYVKNKN